MEGTCRYVSIKTTTDKNCKVVYFEAGKSYNDPGINCGKVRREKQGLKPLFRTSFLLATFSVALGQHRRSCSTVIHFSPHSFTLLCLLSVLACHHDQTGPRLFFFLRGRLRRVLGSTMNYLFVRLGGTPSNSGECPRFSTQPGLPSFFYPFVRALQGRRLEFHGC